MMKFLSAPDEKGEKMKSKVVFLCVMCLGTLLCSGAPVAEEKGNMIILRNAGAEYRFQKGKFYHLLESVYKGRSFWVKGFSLTYNLPGDKWYWEEKPAELYKMAPRTHQIIRKGDTVTLATKGVGKNMTLIRNFTLRGDSPALEVQIRIEVRNRNIINWLNLFSTSFPVTNEFWSIVSRVRDGKISSRLEKIEHPFIDPATGKFHVEGNHRRNQYPNETFICSYDAGKDVGAVMMQISEFSRLPIRVGMSQESSKTIYCNISPYFFNGTEKESYLDARVKVFPFTGTPEQLNKTIVPGFVTKMRSLYVLPQSFDTGIQLKGGSGITLWSDLASQKVYPSSRAPEKKGDAVELFAAKGEGEGFNLALRSEKSSVITWELPVLPFKVEAFPVQLTERKSFKGIVGSHPDVLLEEKSFSLAPEKTAALYVKCSIPENAKAGVYTGNIKLFSNGKFFAAVPVKVTVRDFSIAERTLTAAHDFWWRPHGFTSKVKYKEEFAKIEKMVIDARGGGRWLAPVKVNFDKEGNLIKADYREFDKSVERYTKLYRQPLLVARCFMLGFGHAPRKNLFGEAKEILTPLWKKKMLNFARDFRKHLNELKISDRVIMDLFDEPYEDSYNMFNETIKLLRSVAPEWRFTYAGNFRPELNGYVNFWNEGSTISCRSAALIKAKGGEYSFYNPPVYHDNGELVKVRGYYNYLWREKVRYIYQWVINCWAESGNRGWDNNRCASWVVPSPKGPLSTLRMENTREGIEDYEYWVKLEKECRRLEKKAPRLSAEGRKLLKRAEKLTGRSFDDNDRVMLSNDPLKYEMLHRAAGALLEKMVKVE